MTAYTPTQGDRDLAETLSGYGVPQEDICRLLRISLPTLHRHFREELDLGMAKANALVAASMFQMATSDGPHQGRMAMFWAKARMGWREVPQEVNLNVTDHTSPSPEDRARALAALVARRQSENERGRTH